MIELSAQDKAKILALQNIRSPIVAEVVAIYWTDATRFYATSPLHVHSPTIPVPFVDARLIPEDEDSEEIFQTVTQESALDDDELELLFWDADKHIRTLIRQQGEGIEVKLYYWFPQVELFIENWSGLLGVPDGANTYTTPVKVSQGIRSHLIPLPRRGHYRECQAMFGGLLNAIEIVGNPCNFDKHLGGSIGTNNPATGQPWTFCPRRDPADCTARGVDPLRFLAHRNNVVAVANNQTRGPNLLASSRGNETNLKKAVRVVGGVRRVREMELLARLDQFNNNHPDQGFIRCVMEACEGPIRSISECRVNGLLIQPIHLNVRGGEIAQPPTNFTPGAFNYSGTSLFLAVYGPVNPASYSNEALKGEALIHGLTDLRRYTSPTEYVTEWNDNRAWFILRALTDKRWGLGYSESDIAIQDWIDCGDWGGRYVRFTDPFGGIHDHIRAKNDVDLQERTSQQQIDDLCMAGRFSRPFWWQGKLRMLPLSALPQETLDEAPVFTDEGTYRNIIFDDDDISTLTHSQISDRVLPNRIEVTFDNADNNYLEEPLAVEDEPQQLRAGRAHGVFMRRPVTKKYAALGITRKPHATKYAWTLLDLGPFDEGGLKNNLRISFDAAFFHCLELHPYKVIRVVSSSIADYGFDYFRVLSMEKQANLTYHITAQAYNKDYMDALETEIDTGGGVTGTIYEAEAAANTLAGGASAVSDSACSGGQKVTGLGNGGTLQYNEIYVDDDGEYICRIYYKSNAARQAVLTVNNRPPLLVDFPSTSNFVRYVELNLQLQSASANTIYIANASAAVPDMDKLFVGYIYIDPGDPGDGGGHCRLNFGNVEYVDGQLVVPIDQC